MGLTIAEVQEDNLRAEAARIAGQYGMNEKESRFVALRGFTAGTDPVLREIAARVGVAERQLYNIRQKQHVIEAIRQEGVRSFAQSAPELSQSMLKDAISGTDRDARRDIARTVGLIAPDRIILDHRGLDDRQLKAAEQAIGGLIDAEFTTSPPMLEAKPCVHSPTQSEHIGSESSSNLRLASSGADGCEDNPIETSIETPKPPLPPQGAD